MLTSLGSDAKTVFCECLDVGLHPMAVSIEFSSDSVSSGASAYFCFIFERFSNQRKGIFCASPSIFLGGAGKIGCRIGCQAHPDAQLWPACLHLNANPLNVKKARSVHIDMAAFLLAGLKCTATPLLLLAALCLHCD